ncbi:MAG TPA: hypothetical protein VGF11_03505, partial [Acidimicrobiales bacterium]
PVMASWPQHEQSESSDGEEVVAAELRSDHRMERRFLFSGILAFAAAGVVILIRHVLGSM